MTALACILLCAAAAVLRDGWPPLHSTQLARLSAGIISTCGALAVFPGWHGFVLGAAIYAGYFTDQQHAKGQGGATWRDAAYLSLSGVTSLVPLAVASVLIFGPWAGLLVLVGLLKPPIWFACWYVRPDRWWPWAQPTRIAAMSFGGVVGGVLACL